MIVVAAAAGVVVVVAIAGIVEGGRGGGSAGGGGIPAGMLLTSVLCLGGEGRRGGTRRGLRKAGKTRSLNNEKRTRR